MMAMIPNPDVMKEDFHKCVRHLCNSYDVLFRFYQDASAEKSRLEGQQDVLKAFAGLSHQTPADAANPGDPSTTNGSNSPSSSCENYSLSLKATPSIVIQSPDGATMSPLKRRMSTLTIPSPRQTFGDLSPPSSARIADLPGQVDLNDHSSNFENRRVSFHSTTTDPEMPIPDSVASGRRRSTFYSASHDSSSVVDTQGCPPTKTLPVEHTNSGEHCPHIELPSFFPKTLNQLTLHTTEHWIHGKDKKPEAETTSGWRYVRSQIWDFFEQPDGGVFRRSFHRVFNLLIVLSVVSPITATTNISEVARTRLSEVDLFFTVLFTAEISLRFLCCPRICVFLKSMYTVVDVFVVVAGYINMNSSDSRSLLLQLIATQVPILRLLKITRHSDGWRLLVLSMKRCIVPLLVPLYLMVLMVVFSGSLHFWVDKSWGCTDTDGEQCPYGTGPAFDSIPHAMWFVIVTVSTVGYGDIVPHTTLGKVLASMQILAGICYMAMPLAIIGHNFSDVWHDRHRLLVREQLIRRLQYVTLEEIRSMFHSIDINGDHRVSFNEFVGFVESLKLNLSRRGIFDLFQNLDVDESQRISFDEFVDFLLPEGTESIALKSGRPS
jgi:voltage-gated potassium channel